MESKKRDYSNFDKRLKASISYFLLENILTSKTNDLALEWLKTPNPILGGVVPAEMILIGREHKLINFIVWQVNGD